MERTLLSAAFDSDFFDPLPGSLKLLPRELKIPDLPKATVEIAQSENVKRAVGHFSNRKEASSLVGPPKQSLDGAPSRVQTTALGRATRL